MPYWKGHHEVPARGPWRHAHLPPGVKLVPCLIARPESGDCPAGLQFLLTGTAQVGGAPRPISPLPSLRLTSQVPLPERTVLGVGWLRRPGVSGSLGFSAQHPARHPAGSQAVYGEQGSVTHGPSASPTQVQPAWGAGVPPRCPERLRLATGLVPMSQPRLANSWFLNQIHLKIHTFSLNH